MMSWLRSCLLTTTLITLSLSQGCSTSINTVNASPEVAQATDEAAPNEAESTETESTETESAEGESSADCQLPEESTPQPLNQPYSVLNEQGNVQYTVTGTDVFRDSALPDGAINFDALALFRTLKATRAYFTEQSCADLKIMRSGLPGVEGIQVSDVIDTMDFMIQILYEDISAGKNTRLKDPAFIEQNFRPVRWLAYDPGYLDETRLRITKYAVFTHPGSREKTDVFDTPVYRLKDDLESEDFITSYTKQEVLSGIFEPGGEEFGKVEPLAYLTRESFEDALLQGTAYINLTDGTSTYFNVDKNNGIAYVAGLDQWQQERYWYFKEVDHLRGYGHSSEAKISIEPGVTFAGDVLNIGLGKIIAIEDRNQNLRIGMIADTGGAFLPNLHQLDFFAGVFPDRATYQQAVQDLPTYTRAYILLKK